MSPVFPVFHAQAKLGITHTLLPSLPLSLKWVSNLFQTGTSFIWWIQWHICNEIPFAIKCINMSLNIISEYNQTYRKHTSCYYCLGLTLCYQLDHIFWKTNITQSSIKTILTLHRLWLYFLGEKQHWVKVDFQTWALSQIRTEDRLGTQGSCSHLTNLFHK